ncbi:hypothetical protein [Rubrivirga sp.]|uniref:hypothetical protein n=1 Tax=Rubrivirga sp. TaxID=1885344 RepID=UPI003C7067A7
MPGSRCQNRADHDGSRADLRELRFIRGLVLAGSAQRRADFYYSAGDYHRALQESPTHGPSLYRRAGLFGQRIGRPTSIPSRAAFWCAADVYRRISGDTFGSIAAQSRRAAAQYERAAPTLSDAVEVGWESGERITVVLEDGGTCYTTVR